MSTSTGLHPIVSQLLQQGRLLDLLIITRFLYGAGVPIIGDAGYESIEKACDANQIGGEYLNRTYDDDPIPVDLLKEFGLESELPVRYEERMEYYPYLDEDKSLSVKAKVDYFDAFQAFKSLKGLRLHMSIKGDGVFTKSLYVKKGQDVFREFVLGLSRGRTGNAWDISDALAYKIPHYIEAEADEVKINSESFVVPEALEYLRNKYDVNAYKVPKSAAISMLRKTKGKHIEDYDHLRVYTFATEGLANTISGGLEKARELGFTPIPYILIEPEEVPDTLEPFIEWLRDKLDYMWRLGMGIPSDGVVVAVDDLSYVPSIKNQYSSENFALKMEHWSFDYYPGVVKSVITNDQRRVNCSCKVTIEPFFTKDGTKATVINCFNPSILVKNGISKGKRIYFERNSGAVNILIHGGRLLKLDLEDAPED